MPSTRPTPSLPAEEATYLERIGARIRELRRAKGIGLEELAEQTGIHRTHLWKIEKGQLNAGILTYVRLAQQLGLAPGDVLPPFEATPDEHG